MNSRDTEMPVTTEEATPTTKAELITAIKQYVDITADGPTQVLNVIVVGEEPEGTLDVLAEEVEFSSNYLLFVPYEVDTKTWSVHETGVSA